MSDSGKMLRLPEVRNRIPLSINRIYTLMGEGKFPRPKKIGVRAVAWVETEIDAWIAQRNAQHLTPAE